MNILKSALMSRVGNASLAGNCGKLLMPSTTVTNDVLYFNFPVVRLISTTPALWAEPVKKKKRIDPAIIKAREDRRKRKIEKQIRKLAKHERQLKPVIELELPAELKDPKSLKERQRPTVKLPLEEEEYRWLLEKKWSRYKFQVNVREVRMLDKLMVSQERALSELKAESEDLFQAAIHPDESYLSLEVKGPVETPPIKDYDPEEGDYFDISRKWE